MVIGIIEDDTLLRKALDTSLKNQGYTTILAGSRKEAIKNIDSSVDLLIVDIGLPDGDGINLYQELQKNGRIPAIFLTAKDDEKDMLHLVAVPDRNPDRVPEIRSRDGTCIPKRRRRGSIRLFGSRLHGSPYPVRRKHGQRYQPAAIRRQRTVPRPFDRY